MLFEGEEGPPRIVPLQAEMRSCTAPNKRENTLVTGDSYFSESHGNHKHMPPERLRDRQSYCTSVIEKGGLFRRHEKSSRPNCRVE